MTEELDLARARVQTMARVAKPTGKTYNGGGTTGDGDVCPLNPEHGRMLTIQASDLQHCPNQAHDGQGDRRPSTRAVWPQKFLSEAVAAWKETHA